jgi:hypothetical protein
VVWDETAPLVLKEFLIALTGHEFSYQQDYVDENRQGMHNKTPWWWGHVAVAITKFRCHIH